MKIDNIVKRTLNLTSCFTGREIANNINTKIASRQRRKMKVFNKLIIVSRKEQAIFKYEF